MDRQCNGLEMIASENYTSPAVMQAVGSALLTNMPKDIPVNGTTEIVIL